MTPAANSGRTERLTNGTITDASRVSERQVRARTKTHFGPGRFQQRKTGSSRWTGLAGDASLDSRTDEVATDASATSTTESLEAAIVQLESVVSWR